MQITKKYPNAVERSISILSVTATDDSDTVAVNTSEDGEVMICRRDHLDVWQQLQALGFVSA